MVINLSAIPITNFVARLVVPLGNESWRWVFVWGAVGLLFLALAPMVPESPRWLARVGRRDAADATFGRLKRALLRSAAHYPSRTLPAVQAPSVRPGRRCSSAGTRPHAHALRHLDVRRSASMVRGVGADAARQARHHARAQPHLFHPHQCQRPARALLTSISLPLQHRNTSPYAALIALRRSTPHLLPDLLCSFARFQPSPRCSILHPSKPPSAQQRTAHHASRITNCSTLLIAPSSPRTSPSSSISPRYYALSQSSSQHTSSLATHRARETSNRSSARLEALRANTPSNRSTTALPAPRSSPCSLSPLPHHSQRALTSCLSHLPPPSPHHRTPSQSALSHHRTSLPSLSSTRTAARSPRMRPRALAHSLRQPARASAPSARRRSAQERGWRGRCSPASSPAAKFSTASPHHAPLASARFHAPPHPPSPPSPPHLFASIACIQRARMHLSRAALFTTAQHSAPPSLSPPTASSPRTSRTLYHHHSSTIASSNFCPLHSPHSLPLAPPTTLCFTLSLPYQRATPSRI